jgi:glycosyltransferase involved in cell wall biosynthesis
VLRKGRKRIAVLLDHGWVDTQAFVREPIVHLAAEGFEIDVMGRATETWTPIEGVRYIPRETLRRPPAQRRLAELVLRAAARREYCLVIATPIVSVAIGAALARLAGVPLVVLHDELATRHDLKLTKTVRVAMYRGHMTAALTIITDLRRVSVLEEDWPGLAGQRYVELPNAPAGWPTPARSRDDVRAELGAGPDDVVLLNAGSLTHRFGFDDVMEALPELPEGTLLVCQSAMSTHRLDPSVLTLLEARYPVRFFLVPRPYVEMDDLVTASDIGVALYRGGIPNVRYVGKGSGKLSRYLRAGKPVIVDRNANLDFVGDSGAGVVITSPAEIPGAIATIKGDYEGYSSRALECFQRELAFDAYWPEVRTRLAELIQE